MGPEGRRVRAGARRRLRHGRCGRRLLGHGRAAPRDDGAPGSVRATRSSSPPTRSRRPRTPSSCAEAGRCSSTSIPTPSTSISPGLPPRSPTRTKAVLAVHLFGRPVEWEELQTAVPAGGRARRGCRRGARRALSRHALRLARSDGLPVVPPAQDRHDRRGRRRHDRRSGARRRRPPASGTTASCPGAQFDIPEPGLNYRLPDLLCAIGIPQLARLEQLLAARERVAGWYTERLEHLVLTPSAAEGDRHGWQAYVVQLDRRDEALHAFGRRGSRFRSAPTPCITSAPTATEGRSRAPTGRSRGRSRYRSRRR